MIVFDESFADAKSIRKLHFERIRVLTFHPVYVDSRSRPGMNAARSPLHIDSRDTLYFDDGVLRTLFPEAAAIERTVCYRFPVSPDFLRTSPPSNSDGFSI